MHTHFFVHSKILFAYRIVIGSDRIWGDPIRNPIIPIGSDRIWADPIRIRSDKTIGLSDRIGFELIRSESDPNPIRQDYRIIGSDRIWADPIRSDPLPPLAIVNME